MILHIIIKKGDQYMNNKYKNMTSEEKFHDIGTTSFKLFMRCGDPYLFHLYLAAKESEKALEKALEWGREGAQETAVFEQKSTLSGDNAARKLRD